MDSRAETGCWNWARVDEPITDRGRTREVVLGLSYDVGLAGTGLSLSWYRFTSGEVGNGCEVGC